MEAWDRFLMWNPGVMNEMSANVNSDQGSALDEKWRFCSEIIPRYGSAPI